MSVMMLKTKCLFVMEEMVSKLMKKEALNGHLWLQEESQSQVISTVKLAEGAVAERILHHVVTVA